MEQQKLRNAPKYKTSSKLNIGKYDFSQNSTKRSPQTPKSGLGKLQEPGSFKVAAKTAMTPREKKSNRRQY